MEEIPTFIPEAVNEILLMLLFLVLGPVENSIVKVDHLKEGSYVESIYLEAQGSEYSVYSIKDLKKEKTGTVAISNLENYRRKANPFENPSDYGYEIIIDFGSPYILKEDLLNSHGYHGIYDPKKGICELTFRGSTSKIATNHWKIHVIDNRMILESVDTGDTYIVDSSTSNFSGEILPVGAIRSDSAPEDETR